MLHHWMQSHEESTKPTPGSAQMEFQPMVRVMSIRGYKAAVLALGAVSLLLLVLLAYSRLELSNMRHRVGRAHDITAILEDDRDMALKAEVTDAVDILWRRMYFSVLVKQPSLGDLDWFVKRQRARAIRDVISYLRTKTGGDLGAAPEAWILEYGNEDTKESLAAVKEILSEESGLMTSNPTVQRTGTSLSDQETNRTPSAAGSRR